MKKAINIIGNIGSGKSTLIKVLKSYFNKLDFLGEPIDLWTQSLSPETSGPSALGVFYSDPAKYSALFQVYVSCTKREQRAGVQSPIFFQERGFESDRRIFTESARRGYSPFEWKVLETFFQSANTDPDIQVLHIYLRTDPGVCYDRMMRRARAEERAVAFEYIENLHELHEKWYSENQSPVLVLCGELDFETDERTQEAIVSKLIEFVPELKDHLSRWVSSQGKDYKKALTK